MPSNLNFVDRTFPFSRSGKSTVVQLMQRFYDPCSFSEKPAAGEDVEAGEEQAGKNGEDGAVKIDDKDLREQDIRWLRSNMVRTGSCYLKTLDL